MSKQEKPSGVDNLGVKLLKPVAESIAVLISYIIKLSLENVCPSEQKIAKTDKEPLSVKHSQPINLLPALSKIIQSSIWANPKVFL